MIYIQWTYIRREKHLENGRKIKCFSLNQMPMSFAAAAVSSQVVIEFTDR